MKIVSIATLSPAACGYAEIRGGHLPVHGLSSVKLAELSRKYLDLTASVLSLVAGGKPSGVEIVKAVVQSAPDAIPEILSAAIQCDLAGVDEANLSIAETVEILTVTFAQTFPESDRKSSWPGSRHCRQWLRARQSKRNGTARRQLPRRHRRSEGCGA